MLRATSKWPQLTRTISAQSRDHQNCSFSNQIIKPIIHHNDWLILFGLEKKWSTAWSYPTNPWWQRSAWLTKSGILAQDIDKACCHVSGHEIQIPDQTLGHPSLSQLETEHKGYRPLYTDTCLEVKVNHTQIRCFPSSATILSYFFLLLEFVWL